MSETLILFVKGYFLFIVCFSFFFVLGHFTLKIISGYISFEGFYARLFIKSLTGLVLSVIIYSYLATSFKTINLGFIFIATFMYRELRKFKRKNNRKLLLTHSSINNSSADAASLQKKIHPLIASSFLIYLWFALIVLKAGDFPFFIPPGDTVFYSDISKMIGTTGQENIYGISNQFSGYYHGLVPYHYFELWLNSSFSSLINSIHLISLYLFTYPILVFISLLGLYSIIEKINKVSAIQQISALLLLFMGGMYLNHSDPDVDFTLNMVESPFECYGEKYASYFPFIICSFLFFMQGNFLIATISLLALPLLSISTFPGLTTGIFLFSVISSVFKRIEKAVLFRMLTYTFLIGLFVLVLYFFWGNLAMTYSYNKPLISFTDVIDFNWHYLKIFLAELFYRTLTSLKHLLLVYAPFIAIAFWLFFKKNLNYYLRNLCLLVLCICFTSLLFYQSFYKMRDSWQFYTNNLVLFNVLLILILIVAFFEKPENRNAINLKIKTLLICILSLLAVRGYYAFQFIDKQKKLYNDNFSSEYLSEIQSLNLHSKEKMRGALICNAKRFYPFESEIQSNLIPYLSLMPQYLPCIYMGSFDKFIHDAKNKVAGNENNNAEFSLFYQFMEKQKSENIFISIEKSQSDFIKTYNIKYLILFNGIKLNNEISGKISKVISDTKSKQKFILLK